VLDAKRGQALLFNDRQGSRPLFRRISDPVSACIAPQTRFLSRIEPQSTKLNTAAIGEFLVRGCFYGTDTLFDDIEKVPQASAVVISQTGLTWGRYWNLHYGPASSDDEDALTDEFDRLIRQATRRLLDIVGNPAVLLSGGLDSRLMLAYLLAEGATPRCFSYTTSDGAGDDHSIAKAVADHCGLPHEIYPIPISDFERAAVKETLAADGRVQMIDAPSNRWEYIGAIHPAMFIGDECFGWQGKAHTPDEALDLVGWWNTDAAPRISDWIRREKYKDIVRGIEAKRRRLIDDAGRSDNHNDLKDWLYYSERMGNLLNGYSARRLAVAEQARPFLDEDVIDFLSKVPSHLRCDKALARKLIQSKFPSLHALPYATRTSVPWRQGEFVSHVAGNAELYEFIIANISDKLDARLAGVLDARRLKDTAIRFFGRDRLPPLKDEWWTRVPGMWRFTKAKADRVGTLRGLLRVLQLNLFLTN
jgi:asparagine synthetase B (glutamine-hydrolysing)